MKRVSIRGKHVLAVAALLLSLAGVGRAEDEVLDTVRFDKVPLTDAIVALARQGGLNCILDPNVPGSTFGRGRLHHSPLANDDWKKITALDALNRLLLEHQMRMVLNPATTVARIVVVNAKVKPVAASQIGARAGGDAIMGVMNMDKMRLTNVIATVAGNASLKAEFDPAVTAPAFANQGTISFKWQHITARQALAALLDNYGLSKQENPTTSVVRISVKAKGD